MEFHSGKKNELSDTVIKWLSLLLLDNGHYSNLFDVSVNIMVDSVNLENIVLLQLLNLDFQFQEMGN